MFSVLVDGNCVGCVGTTPGCFDCFWFNPTVRGQRVNDVVIGLLFKHPRFQGEQRVLVSKFNANMHHWANNFDDRSREFEVQEHSSGSDFYIGRRR